MSEPPESVGCRHPDNNDHQTKDLIAVHVLRLLTHIGFVTFTISGMLVIFGNDQQFNQFAQESALIPNLLGEYILEMRRVGLSDESIAATLLMMAGANFQASLGLTSLVQSLRKNHNYPPHATL